MKRPENTNFATKSGKRFGSEVVQIYVADIESRLPRPVKELKGFTKLKLEPGESVEAVIHLDKRAFRYWDPGAGESGGSGGWMAEPGEFRILAGRGSRNIEAEAIVTLGSPEFTSQPGG